MLPDQLMYIDFYIFLIILHDTRHSEVTRQEENDETFLQGERIAVDFRRQPCTHFIQFVERTNRLIVDLCATLPNPFIEKSLVMGQFQTVLDVNKKYLHILFPFLPHRGTIGGAEF